MKTIIAGSRSIVEYQIVRAAIRASGFSQRIHEDVLIFALGSLPYNPQLLDGKPYKIKRSKRDDTGDNYGAISQRTDTINNGKRNPISVLEFDRETGLHPTQKPVALFEYLIRTYSNEGATILDNCCGSGTTGVACVNTSRSSIQFELSPEYYAISSARLDASIEKVLATEYNPAQL